MFAAVAVGALATPSLTYNVFGDGGVVPLWVLTSGTAAQVLLLVMQIRLFTAHRRGSTLGLMADGFAGWASTIALLLLLGPEALSPPRPAGCAPPSS